MITLTRDDFFLSIGTGKLAYQARAQLAVYSDKFALICSSLLLSHEHHSSRIQSKFMYFRGLTCEIINTSSASPVLTLHMIARL